MLKRKSQEENLSYIDLTTSTTASDNDYVEEVKPVTEKISKKIGRPRKVNFDSGNTDVVEVE